MPDSSDVFVDVKIVGDDFFLAGRLVLRDLDRRERTGHCVSKCRRHDFAPIYFLSSSVSLCDCSVPLWWNQPEKAFTTEAQSFHRGTRRDSGKCTLLR